MERISIHELNEFLIDQAQDQTAMIGCTAIIVPDGAVCDVDVRGGSPVTRDTDALDPRCNRKAVHAVVLSGVSISRVTGKVFSCKYKRTVYASWT